MAVPLKRGAVAGVPAVAALVGGALAWNHLLVGVFYDDGIYAGLAWSLSHGGGFAYPNLPGTPAAIHFPPLYPLILAPFFGIFSVDVAGAAGRLLNIAALAWGSWLIARHAVRLRILGDTPPWVSEALVAAAALAIPVLTVLGVLLSEPLFTLALAGVLTLLDAPFESWTGRRALGIGLLTAAALLLRSVGIALLVASLVTAWRHRASWKTVALLLVPGVIAGAAWALWVAVHRSGVDPALGPDYGSYAEIVKQAGFRTFLGSLTDLPRPLSVLTLNWVPSRWVYFALGIPALIVGGVGLCAFARRSSAGWMLIAYLVILTLWPYPPDRFLWAVLPWLGLAFAAGVVTCWGTGKRMIQVPALALAVLLAFGYARYEVRGVANRWWDLTARRISANMAELLPAIDSLPATSVVATDNEPMAWLYTRRRAVPFYLFAYSGRQLLQPVPGYQMAYLQRLGVTHVLLSGPGTGSAAQLDRLVGAYPNALSVVRRWPDGRALYQVRRDHP